MSSRRLPANSAGRSNGVPLSSVLLYEPCKSGSPQPVRGGVHVRAGLAAARPCGVCAAIVAAAIDVIAAANENAVTRCLRMPAMFIAIIANGSHVVEKSRGIIPGECGARLHSAERRAGTSSGCGKDRRFTRVERPGLS